MCRANGRPIRQWQHATQLIQSCRQRKQNMHDMLQGSLMATHMTGDQTFEVSLLQLTKRGHFHFQDVFLKAVLA